MDVRLDGCRRMSSLNYRVESELFCGPLDLLLYLVRRQEIDIVELQVAAIAAQFQEFLDVLEVIDIDLVGDFVVMASTLAEIKSREVLPRQDEEVIADDAAPLDADESRSELIHRLLEYKKFKDAALALEERAARWHERYPRLASDRPATAKDPASDRIKEVVLWDLISALGRVLRRQDVEEHARIRDDDTPIHVYVERIGTRVRAEREVLFHALFEKEAVRSKIVGMFLAVLELLRHHGFRARQDVPFGEILILPPLDEPAGEAGG